MGGGMVMTVLAYITGAGMVFYAFSHPDKVSALINGSLTGFRQYIVGLANLSGN
jgi:hypothetical protein